MLFTLIYLKLDKCQISYQNLLAKLVLINKQCTLQINQGSKLKMAVIVDEPAVRGVIRSWTLIFTVIEAQLKDLKKIRF